MPRLPLGLLALTIWGGAPSHPTANARPDARSCQACHQRIVASFSRTAHFQTSAEATARAIRGRFSEGHNLLHTRVEGVSFKMERRNGAFYQTGVDSLRGTSRTESIDLVIGSGRRGQSYLYWRGGLLFELPTSYLTAIGQWINSPGYTDGQIDFRRLIIPRCLECHTTSFVLLEDRGRVRYSREYVLGISCENATATVAPTSAIRRRTRRPRPESTFSIPAASRGTGGWANVAFSIPAMGVARSPGSYITPAGSLATIFALPPTKKPCPPPPAIRSGHCGGAN